MSSKAHPPEIKRYLDKKLSVRINGNRTLTGYLRGFDPFMNMVIDETVEHCKDGNKQQIGMVVIRGNSVVILEALDRV